MFESRSFFGGHNKVTPYDVYKNGTPDLSKLADAPSGSNTIRANKWLPYAAEQYNISRNIKDYVIVPTIGMISDLPNTNGDSLSLSELLRFNPEHGRQMYETWIGKGTFEEHSNNTIPSKASGVILDCFIKRLKRFGNDKYFKVVILSAWDRNKNPKLVNNILNGTINSYSVGFYFKSYTCSICGKTFGQGNTHFCEHTAPRKPTYVNDQRRLAFRRCLEAVAFEMSAVANPAFVSNLSDHVFDPSKI